MYENIRQLILPSLPFHRSILIDFEFYVNSLQMEGKYNIYSDFLIKLKARDLTFLKKQNYN